MCNVSNVLFSIHQRGLTLSLYASARNMRECFFWLGRFAQEVSNFKKRFFILVCWEKCLFVFFGGGGLFVF